MSCHKRTVSSFGLFTGTLTLLTGVPTPAFAGGFVGVDILYTSVLVTIYMSVLAIPALVWSIWLQRKDGAAKLTWRRAFVIILSTSACAGGFFNLLAYLSEVYVGLPRLAFVEYFVSMLRQVSNPVSLLIGGFAIIVLPVAISFKVAAKALLHSEKRQSADDKANSEQHG
jgi:hypothetical protein